MATQAFREFYPELEGQVDVNVALEEIEEEADGKHWLITLGYDAKRKLSGYQAMLTGLNDQVERVYKTFRIHKGTGKVVSMKIRSLA